MARASVYITASPVPVPDVAILTAVAGAFVLAVPAPGRYEFAATAAGFAPATVGVTVPVGPAQQLSIRLGRAD